MIVAWDKRSPEVAALFNPAFCGLVIYAAIEGFTTHDRTAMPFALSFIILPVVLHTPSRELLPTSVRTPFHSWIAASPTLRIGFADRVKAVRPITQESLLLLAARRCISNSAGEIAIGSKKPKMSKAKQHKSPDVKDAILAAGLLGRLLSRAGQTATIYTSLGIEP